MCEIRPAEERLFCVRDRPLLRYERAEHYCPVDSRLLELGCNNTEQLLKLVRVRMCAVGYGFWHVVAHLRLLAITLLPVCPRLCLHRVRGARTRSIQLCVQLGHGRHGG